MANPTTRKTRVLLTGFGPFPGVPVNASRELARELAEAAVGRYPGVEVLSAALPTEWQAGPAELQRLLAQLQPDIALHFGVSDRARGFEIEARAHNRCEASQDAAGNLTDATQLIENAPNSRGASIDARRLVEELRRAQLPAFLSRDAGGYLCNAVFYHSLAFAKCASSSGREQHQAGFVHIPANLAAARRWPKRPVSPLSWADAVRGGQLILATCLRSQGLPASV